MNHKTLNFNNVPATNEKQCHFDNNNDKHFVDWFWRKNRSFLLSFHCFFSSTHWLSHIRFIDGSHSFINSLLNDYTYWNWLSLCEWCTILLISILKLYSCHLWNFTITMMAIALLRRPIKMMMMLFVMSPIIWFSIGVVLYGESCIDYHYYHCCKIWNMGLPMRLRVHIMWYWIQILFSECRMPLYSAKPFPSVYKYELTKSPKWPKAESESYGTGFFRVCVLILSFFYFIRLIKIMFTTVVINWFQLLIILFILLNYFNYYLFILKVSLPLFLLTLSTAAVRNSCCCSSKYLTKGDCNILFAFLYSVINRTAHFKLNKKKKAVNRNKRWNGKMSRHSK